MNSTNYCLEKFQSHGRNDVPTGGGEHEKQLVSLDVRELDPLALLKVTQCQ